MHEYDTNRFLTNSEKTIFRVKRKKAECVKMCHVKKYNKLARYINVTLVFFITDKMDFYQNFDIDH